MKYLIALVWFVVFFGILIGANLYLANSYNFFFNLDIIGILYTAFGLTTLFMFFGSMSTMNNTGILSHYVHIIAFTLLGFFLYLLLSTLFIDLVSLIIKIEPQIQGIVSLGLALTISLYGIINARITQISSESIEIEGLTKAVKALHLTDTHLGHFRGGKTLAKLVKRINNEEVDVVFFTGDLLDGAIQLKEESMLPLKDLQAPVYFVEGNHDKYTGIDTIKKYLVSIGVKVLTNEIAQWNELQIIGLNHMLADSTAFDMHAGRSRLTVKSALEMLQYDADKPLILLHHGPAGIKHAAAAGVDLYLAGHTHGGQMFPATLVAKAMFEYNRGLHKYENTHIYVCSGTGTFGPPMRVGTRSEMTILHLKPSK